MAEKVRAHLIIEGKVQGVSFRYSTIDAAVGCGVTGWVQNTDDGNVEAVFEGDRDDVRKVVEWCSHGPRFAMVKNVKADWEPFTGEFSRFGIRF